MIRGIGIDIVEIQRFVEILKTDAEKFLHQNFTTEECSYCSSFADAATHFAGTFAAKEAIRKATGFALPYSAINIHRSLTGQPEVQLPNEFLTSLLISISHDHGVACAVAIHEDLPSP